MIAASHNDRDVLQLLLDHGIEIDARDREGWSALMAAAAFNQDPQVGRLLLAAGAETKPGGSVGTRALIMPGWPEEITAAGEAIGEAGIAAFELTPGGEPAVLVAALYGQKPRRAAGADRTPVLTSSARIRRTDGRPRWRQPSIPTPT